MVKTIHIEIPEFTRDRVLGTYIGLYESRFDFMLAGICELHSKLYPSYANNDSFKFMNKTIIHNVFNKNGFFSSFSYGKQRFSDLMKYLCLLDGLDTSDVPEAQSMASKLGVERQLGSSSVKFDQCEVRMFANGNIHVLLHDRPDLLARINDALASYHKGALPK
jgi:hypothetical protein